MTRAAKITYLVALLIGLSGGAFAGYWLTADGLRVYSLVTQSFAPDVFGKYAFLQYCYADTEHAKEALQSYADFLEEMENEYPDFRRKRDLSEAYTRLAILEDSVGNAEQSQVFMTKARFWYAASGGRELPDSEMKNAIKKMDGALPQ
jgi:hypothetical protein